MDGDLMCVIIGTRVQAIILPVANNRNLATQSKQQKQNKEEKKC